MDDPIRIDARGMRCPRPVVELAKAARRYPAGTVLEVQADDLAFDSDVEAWCSMTGHTLLGRTREGDVVTATIRFEAAARP
jgi:TusA-related sulfurtransferase